MRGWQNRSSEVGISRRTASSKLGWPVRALSILVLATLASTAHTQPSVASTRLEGTTDFSLLAQHRDVGLEFVFETGETSETGANRVQAEAQAESMDPFLNAGRLGIDRIDHTGGFILSTPTGSIDLTDFALVRISSDYDFQLVDAKGRVWFDVRSPHYVRSPDGGLLITDATLQIARALAEQMELPALEGFMLGELQIDLEDPNPAARSEEPPSALNNGTVPPFGCGASYGPPVDVELTRLSNLQQRARAGGRVAVAPSAELLNVGPNVVDWGRSMPGAPSADLLAPRGEFGWIGPHPNLSLHFYRQQGTVIEQIGVSDVKHAFLSINSGCDSPTCQGGQLLGIGCGDVYGPGNNSNPQHFGPRDEVSAFPVSWNSVGSHFDVGSDNFYSHPTASNPEIDSFTHRLVVQETNLTTPGARYFAEAWYLVAGDTNIFNSMAHYELTPSLVGEVWMFTPVPGTDSTQGSILDEVVDPNNLQQNQSNQIFDTGTGRVQVTGSATDNGNGTFTFEYAMMNFDYDAQVQTFSVPLAAGAVATNLIFRGNGETPGPAWTPTVTADAVTWQAPIGEALDWGRMVSFSVTVDRSPVPSVATLSALETADNHVLGVVGTVPLAQNDDPAMAAAVSSGSTFGTLAGADAEGVGVSTIADGQPDVWYSYTPASSGILRIHTCGSFTLSGVDTALSVHSAVPGTIGNQLAANDNYPAMTTDLPAACSSSAQAVDSLVDVNVVQGTPVFVRVAAADGQALSFQLTLVAPSLANDDAANAQPIGVGTFTASLDGATPDGSSTSSSGTPDIWYSITAASTGTLIIDTCGTINQFGTDTFLSVHSSAPGSPTNELAENDDAPYFDATFFDPEIASPTSTACDPDASDTFDSALAVNVTAGQTVLLRVTDFFGEGGSFKLNVSGPGTPALSLFVRGAFDPNGPRLDFLFNDYFFQGENVDFFWGSTGNTCTASGSWTGPRSTGSGGTEFVTLNNGGPYTLTCTSPAGSTIATRNLRVEPIAANDTCAARALRQPPFGEAMSNFWAGIDSGERLSACALDGASLWYEVTPSASGTLALSTIGSNYDTVLSVWDGDVLDPCDESAAIELACNDDEPLGVQSRLVLQVTGGQSLIVRVAAYGEFDPEPDPEVGPAFFDNPDQLSFDAAFITPLTNDDCVDAIDIIAPVEGEAVQNATTSDATVESNEPSSLCSREEATVWYRVVSTTDQLLRISTAGSTYDTVLSVFDGTEQCGAIETELACNDDAGALLTSEVTVPATTGQVFHVRVSAFPGVFPTDLTLTVPEPSGALQGLCAVAMLGVLGTRRRRSERRAGRRS